MIGSKISTLFYQLFRLTEDKLGRELIKKARPFSVSQILFESIGRLQLN